MSSVGVLICWFRLKKFSIPRLRFTSHTIFHSNPSCCSGHKITVSLLDGSLPHTLRVEWTVKGNKDFLVLSDPGEAFFSSSFLSSTFFILIFSYFPYFVNIKVGLSGQLIRFLFHFSSSILCSFSYFFSFVSLSLLFSSSFHFLSVVLLVHIWLPSPPSFSFLLFSLFHVLFLVHQPSPVSLFLFPVLPPSTSLSWPVRVVHSESDLFGRCRCKRAILHFGHTM